MSHRQSNDTRATGNKTQSYKTTLWLHKIQNTIVVHAMHVRFHVVIFITLLLLFIFGRSCQNNKKK